MGDRTVSVWLKAQVSDYFAKIASAAKVTGELDDAAGKAAGSLKKLSGALNVVAGNDAEPKLTKVSKSTVKLGDEADTAADAVEKLGEELDTAADTKLGDTAATTAKDTARLGTEAAKTATEADKLKTSADRASDSVTELGTDAIVATAATSRLGAGMSGVRDTLTGAAASARNFGSTINAAAKADKLDELNRTALVTGGVLIAAFIAPVKAAADFDKAMSKVDAATHATVTEMSRLRAAAIQAGAATSFSAVEAAQGITELAKAGVSTADILSGGLKGALDLAAAGEMKVGDAAEVAATAMAQFHLTGSQIPHVADLLAAGAGKAQGEVSDMAYALKMGGLVANQFGISVEDTVGTLAAFANAGLIGSDAGTSFKTMLLALVRPSEAAKALMKGLGIETFDAQGSFVGLESLAGSLKTSLSGLSEEQRNAALATIFGSDAIRAASILYDQGAQGIVNWRNEVNEAGYATDTANRKLNNLAGDLEKLKGSIETNLIEAGTGANKVLRGLVQGAEGVVDSLGAIPAPVAGVGVGMVGVAGAFALVTGGMGMAIVKMHETRKALDEINMTGGRTEKAMIGVAQGAGKIAAALVATQVVSASFGSSVNPQIASLVKGMEQFAKTGQASGEAARLFGKNLELLRYDLDQLGNFDTGAAKVMEGLTGMGALFDKSVQHATERLSGYDQALSAMVQSGKSEEAKAAFERLAKVAKEEGTSLEELKAAFPGYMAALEGATAAELAAIKAGQDHKAVTKALNGTVGEAIDLFGSFKKAMDALNGEARSYERALNDAEAAVDDMTASVKEHGSTLDRTTAAGRANREAVLKGTEAAEAAAQATYDHNVATLGETEATRLATETYKHYIDALFKQLPITKENEQAAKDLKAAVSNMPPLVRTDVKVEIPKTVVPELKVIDSTIKGLENKQVKIDESGAPDAEARIARLNKQIRELEDRKVKIEEQGAGPAAVEVDRLDAEIKGLESRKVAVYEEGAADSDMRIQRMQAAIDRLRDKKVHIEAQVNSTIYESRNYVDLRDFQDTHGNLRGGVYTHAQKGLVNAGVFPAGPTKYAFAEKATGGEIFAPRLGDLARTRSIVDYGVNNWWGGTVRWGGGDGGRSLNIGGINVTESRNPQATGAAVVQAIRDYERSNGPGWRK